MLSGMDESPNQFSLLSKRRFGPFFLTQALGAFNDNVCKQAMVVLVVFQGARLGIEGNPDVLANVAAGLFILPYFLLSATAGQLADKYEKSRQIRLIKGLECTIMVLATAGFVTASFPILMAALFLMGVQSTFFGPIKYGILPQHLRREELVGGNGLVEMGTFVAILLGTIAGGELIGWDRGAVIVSGVLLATAVAGLIASLFVPQAPAVEPTLKINWNPVTETWRNLKFLRGNRTVFLSVLGISWFWFFGANFLTQMPNYARIVLGGDHQVSVLLLALFSIGIGAGSLLCEKMSGGRVELGLVPLGSIGLTLFAVDLYFATPDAGAGGAMSVGAFLAADGTWRIVTDLVLIGLFGGFYIVPLYALVQDRSEPAHRSRVIAGNNILNAAFMVVGAVVAATLLSSGVTIPQLFLITGIFNALVAVYIYTLVPEFLMRLLTWLLINTIYRVRPNGVNRIPENGPCLVAANHVSFVDPLIVGGHVRRPIRFVMYHKIFKIPVLNFVFRTARAIPIAPAKEDPQLLEDAYDEVSKALREGDVVGIFPEGGLCSDGEIAPFRPGIEKILERDPVPVYPAALTGLWGSLFSRRDPLPKRRPRKLWARIGLIIGDPIPAAEATAERVESEVRALRGDRR